MADNYFQDVSNDIAGGTNWSLGSAPADTNSVFFLLGSTYDLTVNLDQRSVADVDLPLLVFGGTFYKSVGDGTGSSVYKLDDVTELQVNVAGPVTQVITLDIDGLTKGVIRGTGANPKALYLYDGTTANLFISSGNVTLGAGQTITGNIYLTQEGPTPPVLRIEAGCTLTNCNIYADAGVIDSLAELDCTLISLTGPVHLKQRGASGEANIGAQLIASNGAKVSIETTVAATLSNIKFSKGAVLDTTGSAFKTTISAGDVMSGAEVKVKQGVDSVACNVVGGRITGAVGTLVIPGH